MKTFHFVAAVAVLTVLVFSNESALAADDKVGVGATLGQPSANENPSPQQVVRKTLLGSSWRVHTYIPGINSVQDVRFSESDGKLLGHFMLRGTPSTVEITIDGDGKVQYVSGSGSQITIQYNGKDFEGKSKGTTGQVVDVQFRKGG